MAQTGKPNPSLTRVLGLHVPGDSARAPGGGSACCLPHTARLALPAAQGQGKWNRRPGLSHPSLPHLPCFSLAHTDSLRDLGQIASPLWAFPFFEMGIINPSFTGESGGESSTEEVLSKYRCPSPWMLREREWGEQKDTQTFLSTSPGQAGRPWGWELSAGKDMMMQYSPSASVSWMATDWSMLVPVEQAHPGR